MLPTRARRAIRQLSRRLRGFVSAPPEAPDAEFDLRIRGVTLRLQRCRTAWALEHLRKDGYDASAWEPSVRRLMEALFAERTQVFFDIGANVGVYSYIAAVVSPSIRVHAFEPLPSNVAYLQQAVLRNGLSNITVVPLALSDFSGDATFFVPVRKDLAGDYSADMSSLINRFEGSDRRHNALKAREISVRVSTLDDYVAAHGVPRLDVIKLDVEEAELQALHGAAATLERFSPDIVCEVLFDNPQKLDIFRFLADRGYRGYLVTEFGLIPEESPVFVRPCEGEPNLAVWNDHFFSRRDEPDISALSVSAFGTYNGAGFFRAIADRDRYVVG